MPFLQTSVQKSPADTLLSNSSPLSHRNPSADPLEGLPPQTGSDVTAHVRPLNKFRGLIIAGYLVPQKQVLPW